jgi:hypothetical protein
MTPTLVKAANSRGKVAATQRARILDAMVEMVGTG